jgi:hypothetical protein
MQFGSARFPTSSSATTALRGTPDSLVVAPWAWGELRVSKMQRSDEESRVVAPVRSSIGRNGQLPSDLTAAVAVQVSSGLAVRDGWAQRSPVNFAAGHICVAGNDRPA